MRAANYHQRAFGPRDSRHHISRNTRQIRRFHIRRCRAIRRISYSAQHVFRQCQNHRTGATGHGHLKRTADIFGNPVGMINLGHPFGNAAKHRTVIDLLKRLTISQAIVNLTDKQHHRRAILLGDMHPRACIRSPRSARHKTHTRLARHLSISLGHHRSTALLATHDVWDTAVVKTIQRGKKAFTRYGKHTFHTQRLQMIA